MACELWVRGEAENGGHMFADVLVSQWDSVNTPFPALTVIPQNDPRGFTRYSASPAWQYNAAGWYQYPEFYLKNCTQANERCDCVNGGCVPKTTYNTPGKFANLAACEAGCAKDSSCNGECVTAEEMAALQQAAAKVRGKLCGGFV
jgi:hypothetical protein